MVKKLAKVLNLTSNDIERLEEDEPQSRSLGRSSENPDSPQTLIVEVGGTPLHTASDPEGEFYKLVCSAWVAALTPEDRMKHPCQAHVFTNDFVQALRDQNADALGRIAHACAMIACDLAPRLDLEIHPLSVGPDGPQVVRRNDRAKGWQCALTHPPDGSLFHFFVHQDDTIEFSTIGYHELATG
jgi:hypothetical protein